MRTPSPGATQTHVLDGLRGLAALLVVASHSSLLGMHWVPGFSMAGIGKYGVYLFFVLSAFLLTAQWLASFAERRPLGSALTGYAVRRVLRIFPLYFVVLVVGWLLGGKGLGVPMDTPTLLRHVALLEGRDLYWSVPVEFKYYAVIPLLAALWSSRLPITVRGSLTAALLVVSMLLYPPSQTPLNSVTLGYYLPCFLAGSVAAWFWATLPEARRNTGNAVPAVYGHVLDGVLVVVLILTVPATAELLGRASDLDGFHRQFLAWGVLWSVVLQALIQGWLPGWHRLLMTGLMRRCGHWSFALYLLHMPALYVAKRLPLPGPARAWIGLLLALLVAAAIHRWLELPAIRLGRALSARFSRDAP